MTLAEFEPAIAVSERLQIHFLDRAATEGRRKFLKPYWSRDAPSVQHSTTVRSAHTVFMCFVFT
jgi:hypothetical protein